MKTIKLICLASLLLVIMSSCGTTSYTVRERPAEVVYTRPPRPSPNHIWVSGNWVWRGGRYVWEEGYWTLPRSRAHYVEGYWSHGRKGWLWHPGHW